MCVGCGVRELDANGGVRSQVSGLLSSPVQSSLDANGGVPSCVFWDAACASLMQTGEFNLVCVRMQLDANGGVPS